MKLKRLKLLSFTLILALLATILPACSPVFVAESYMALIPEVLHSGQTEEISLALFNGENLASGGVEVILLDTGR